ncbi:hypothetical protein [Rhizorhapis suberifaciens]|uniref:Uncharacterized protein n=1 Tax=Rhizorhapis suberifaciens TaxID=13656 RepID=A0A840HYK2_9SPHN|nr:hypothetical protein [Rhizorhapis suberifaciens]MBB4642649.1 hypothetical protein [Rhizorhapis suberifaciens]
MNIMVVAAAVVAAATAPPSAPIVTEPMVSTPTVRPVAQIVPPGTPVRLMILKEITSRNARNGERFKLRVDEPVYINGSPLIPVGTTAWGEIVEVKKNGAVGKAGRLNARLLHIDLPTGPLPLRGEFADRGDGNGAGVVLAVVGFGLLGLLNGGDSGRLKAGDTFTGYVDKVPAPAETDPAVPPTVGGAGIEQPQHHQSPRNEEPGT